MNIAVIPARGGSKRLPGKNLRLFAGKPLIAWTIECALTSGCFSKVLVTTDDPDIALVAKSWGAEVPFLRPAHLATDAASSQDVLAHAITDMSDGNGADVNYVMLLQPTSPLRQVSDIHASFRLLEEKNADAIVSVCESAVPLSLCNQLPDNHVMTNFVTPASTGTQKALYYQLNGAIYLMTRAVALDLSQLYEAPTQTFAYIMPQSRSADIDTELDFLWAEFLAQQKIR
ncbi:acylneuraminate cytidylyltransferase family protein [Aliidiomarina maris]|uniref:Acylneuraminate cytidylyltransferase family protein n=1 Tax=Aliidiomarina maris TaxID=531312 RepID=A0A327X5C9_9GAMM|nr:acylneuraminate cytidylyltransferase family protein [Aliidiomarina maris]RAK00735.1 N-acylneuraminate cytidylyltransferase/CMP-N,N'-diacetyllegionaminic acid synthase [Aliidiomarina maris]RUO27266.1 acylneuraminate cytidylyltransferase family protein [Aliidiomarina maris]